MRWWRGLKWKVRRFFHAWRHHRRQPDHRIETTFESRIPEEKLRIWDLWLYRCPLCHSHYGFHVAGTTRNSNNLMCDAYLPGIRDQVNQENVFWKRMEKPHE